MNRDGLSIIDLKQMKRDIDTILDSIIKNKEQDCKNASIFIPSLDIIESDEKLFIHIELPGIKKEDIEINYYKGYLELKGKKSRNKNLPEELNFLRIERCFGDLFEIVEVPKAINARLSKACLRNGVLTIELIKVIEKRGKIKINIE